MDPSTLQKNALVVNKDQSENITINDIYLVRNRKKYS